MDRAPASASPADSGLPLIGRLGIGAISLIVANASVLLLYFIYGATLFQLVLVYWCECLWIGIFAAIKLLAASLFGNPYENRWAAVSPGGALFLSIFVIAMTSSAFFSLLGLALMAILWASEALPLASEADDAMNQIFLVLGVSLLFAAGHLLSLVVNFFILGEFRRARVGALVALPFKRCRALLAAIIAAFAAITLAPGLATTSGFAAALIVAKLLGDLGLHLAERRAFADRTGPGA